MNISKPSVMIKESVSFSDFIIRCLIAEITKGDDGLERGVISIDYDQLLKEPSLSSSSHPLSFMITTGGYELPSFINKEETSSDINNYPDMFPQKKPFSFHLQSMFFTEITSGAFGTLSLKQSSIFRNYLSGTVASMGSISTQDYEGNVFEVLENYRQYLISLLKPYANIIKFEKEFHTVRTQNEKREKMVTQLEQRVVEFDNAIEQEVSKFNKIKIESTSIMKNLDDAFNDVSNELIELKKKLLSDISKSAELNDEAKATIIRLSNEIDAENARLEAEKQKTLELMGEAEKRRLATESTNKKLKIASAFIAVGSLFI